MIHHRFYVNVFIRVTFITLTSLVLAYVVFHRGDLYIAVNILLLLIIQVFLLLHYINRVNRDLTVFFGAVSSDDTTVVYKKSAKGRSFENLYEQFDQISQRIQLLRLENSRRSYYLQHLVDNAGIGILSYTVGGKIDILNPAAKHLLKLSPSTKILMLDDMDPALAEQLSVIKSGEQCLLKAGSKVEPVPLSIRASEFVIQGETIRLLTFQSIKNELEENEQASWQKLIRTLTHEIMNSVGPISSSIRTIRSFYEKEPVESGGSVSFTRETLKDTLRGLDIIDERAQGMLEFVNRFRSLTIIPEPERSVVKVHDLFRAIERLFSSEIMKHHILLTIVVDPESLCITADKQLTEQVLINLVTNSIHSLQGVTERKIKLAAFSDQAGRIWIQVIDNGKGISEEISDKIFVPFFTTKEGGSGIGLSLSRQIMMLHNGKITFNSVPGVETVFTLVF
jgi:two-component system, NtrC family, nitrogen regulation sensor histidine kinase NtrY